MVSMVLSAGSSFLSRADADQWVGVPIGFLPAGPSRVGGSDLK